jgi:hypothetical protein
MADSLDTQKSLDLELLLAELEAHQVKYVLVGSVAAVWYGVTVHPGDLDITPAPDPDNLARLAEVLLALEARPLPENGRWEVQPDGERIWVVFDEGTPAIDLSESWVPDVERVSTFDHSFKTRLGELDLLPELVGDYDWLMERATQAVVAGHRVSVAHVDDLLATITVPRRAKDAQRVKQLRAIQHQLGKKQNLL